MNWQEIRRLDSEFVHGNNLLNKLKSNYRGKQVFLEKAWKEYVEWRENNLAITGTDKESLTKKIKLFDQYKKYIDQIPSKEISSQSQFHSTVIEEFLFYLFKDLIKSFNLNKTRIGGVKAYSNLYFSPSNLKNFQEKAFIKISPQNRSFNIYKTFSTNFRNELEFIEPQVIIKCQRYLINPNILKSYLREAENTKRRYPSVLFIVVTETYEVKNDFNLQTSGINQIFVLRKERKSNPLYSDVIFNLIKFVEWKLNPAVSKAKEIYSNIKKYGMVYV